MAVSPLIKPLGITAALLGIIQGTVWFILALLTILIHFEAWTPKFESSTYGQRLSAAIKLGYVNGKDSLGEDFDANLFVRPNNFYISALIYLCTSLLWIGFSSFLLYVLTQRKHQLLKNACLGWVTSTTIISICDLVLASLLASDYDILVTAVNSADPLKQIDATYLILACGVMMTLIAKGFVLWIVNVIFDVLIMKFYIDLPKKMTEDSLNSNTINAFGRPQSTGQPDLLRSNSFSSTSFGTFQGLPRLPPIQSTNERLAHLHRG